MHASSGPAPDEHGKFFEAVRDPGQSWLFHSVSAAIRAVWILNSMPEVITSLIFMTGISWGAHVAQLVAALDPRLSLVAFVYGAGFLEGNADIGRPLTLMSVNDADAWTNEFDPACYLGRIGIPTMWVTGTHDHSYDLERFQRSADLMRTPTVMKITPGFPHSHSDGWAPPEIAAYFSQKAHGTPPIPILTQVTHNGDSLAATCVSELPLLSARLHVTNDSNYWMSRSWSSQPARIDGSTIQANIPLAARAAILDVTDLRGSTVSSPLPNISR